MINLNINYSPEYEITRIKNTLEKFGWYKEKGYRLRFPESFSTEEKNFRDEEYIKKTILDEYKKESYEEQKEFIAENSEKINIALDKFFNETGIKQQDKYEVYLTKYGVGGSYGFPDKIIVNIQVCSDEKLLRTIIHEIIHLSIEDLIQKHNIEHWVKERVVDLTFDKIAPELNILQKMPIKTGEINKVFEENYPNIEKVLEKIKN